MLVREFVICGRVFNSCKRIYCLRKRDGMEGWTCFHLGSFLTLLRIVHMFREVIRIRLGWELGDGKWMKTNGGLIRLISLVSKGGWIELAK